jgi:uroporphyrinogen decarboxylase
MMTSRERMLATIRYESPDRIPVIYHPSPAGLHVHGEKLRELFCRYPPDNMISFDGIPTPPPGTIDELGQYHEIRRDEWGTTWEFLIFGLQGHPKEYPLASWSEGKNFDFPPPPDREMLGKAGLPFRKTDYLEIAGWVSIFEKLHALRPIDQVLMDLATGDRDLIAFLDRLVWYWLDLIHYYIAEGVDVIQFGDDWGTQTGQLVSTGLFRKIFAPRYKVLFNAIRASGKHIFFHSCGRLQHILPEIIALGIDGLWPQISVYEDDFLIDLCREHRFALYIHPDRQRLIPLGTPAEITARVQYYADRFHAIGGGGIFYIEIENDAPFENVKALIEAVHRYR